MREMHSEMLAQDRQAQTLKITIFFDSEQVASPAHHSYFGPYFGRLKIILIIILICYNTW